MATKHQPLRHERLRFFRFFRNKIDHLLAAFSTFFASAKEQVLPEKHISLAEIAPIITAAMAPTKITPFKAYDLRRKHLHTIEGSGGKPAPRKTSIHRIVRSDWSVPKVTKSSGRKSTKQPTTAASLTAARLLRCDREDVCCTHCGHFADEPECSSKCYSEFKKANDAEKLIEIKGPGKHGYGAFTKPGADLKKGQWLGEYVGQLMPLDIKTTSLYRFEIPGVCAIDAEPCGNWTRFVNSSCIPNLSAWTDTVGKRHAVFFQALRDIGPEEELTFNYGKGYFEAAGFKCDCPAMKRPHVPGEHKAQAKAKAKK